MDLQNILLNYCPSLGEDVSSIIANKTYKLNHKMKFNKSLDLINKQDIVFSRHWTHKKSQGTSVHYQADYIQRSYDMKYRSWYRIVNFYTNINDS